MRALLVGSLLRTMGLVGVLMWCGLVLPALVQQPIVPLRVPLLINGDLQADVDILVAMPTGDPVAVDAAQLLDLLAPQLSPDMARALQRATGPDMLLELADLRREGLEAVFNQELLQLEVTVPVDLQATRVLALRAVEAPPALSRALHPAAISGYANLRSSFAAAEQGDTFETFPTVLGMDGALNVRQNVVEGAASWQAGADRPWRRSGTRYIRDFPEQERRLTIGDLNYRVRGLQSFASVGDIAFASDNSLQPYRLARPAGEAGFALESPATVDFFVNERLVRTMRLRPGSYSAQSFPFLSGLNDARIVINDEAGGTEVITFPFTFDTGLLPPGEKEFSLAGGWRSISRNGELRYLVDQPVVSAYQRVGVTERTTVELNGQASRDVEVAGTGVVSGTRAGIVRGDFAASHADAGTGFAGRLQYEYRDSRARNTAGEQWTFAVRYTNPTFRTLTTPDERSGTAWNWSARYARRLYSWGVGVGMDYQLGRGRADTVGTTLQLQRSFGRTTGVTVRVRDELSGDAVRSRAQSIFAAFTVLLGNEDSAVTMSRDTAAGSSRIDGRYAARDPGHLSSCASVDRSHGAQAVNADVAYGGYRGAVGLGVSDVSGRSGDSRYASLRLATAVVYADGFYAFSRPVSDAFAIFVPHESLSGQKIGVNRLQGDNFQAVIDRLGPAVLPEVTPYRVSRVVLDGRNVPIGLDLGPGVIDLAPTYRSGVLVPVGSGATVFLTGWLCTPDGTPIGLQGGKLVALDDPVRPDILTFTNAQGRFAAEGLRPGRYSLSLFSQPNDTVLIVIPAGAAGTFDIASVVVGGLPV